MQIDRDANGVRRKAVHGLSIGILMLNTRFQRIPGDIGYAPTWPFSVQYSIVKEATPERVVEGGAVGLLDAFKQAADDLVALGVDGIATTCGFLAKLQPELAAHCAVPIATSSLLQIPLIERILPKGQCVGVLTADKDALTSAHFSGAGVDHQVPVLGLNLKGALKTATRSGAAVVDRAAQEEEVVNLAKQLKRENPTLGAIVLECTNLAPFSSKIEQVLDMPVYDVVTLVQWLASGLRPRTYSA